MPGQLHDLAVNITHPAWRLGCHTAL